MGPHGLEGNKFEPRSSGAGLAELESNRNRVADGGKILQLTWTRGGDKNGAYVQLAASRYNEDMGAGR
ncbi:hypothetical protein V6N12_009821 [Hibiscus sabdariffa]|uniref:Uncharacterized protein n=1 Tax=Hibiscus sabdariffa TaxID=183260 RepID=A0ABR2EDL3_9ROSI